MGNVSVVFSSTVPSVSKGLRYFIDKVNHYLAQTKMIEMIQLYKHLQLAKEEAKSETELL